MTVNGEEHVLRKGSTFFVPGSAEHGVRNEGREEFRWFYVFPADGFGEVVYRWSGGEGVRVKAKL